MSNHCVLSTHTEYSDQEVSKLYESISQILDKVRLKQKVLSNIAGDWNAEAPRTCGGDESCPAVGNYANPGGNARGQWLKQWASERQLFIVIFFSNDGAEIFGRIALQQGGRDRSIIFCLTAKQNQESNY